MERNEVPQSRIGGLYEHKNRLSAFKPVIPGEKAHPYLLPVLLGRHNSMREDSIEDKPLAALESFVTNYFSEESILEPNRVPLKKQQSFNRKPVQKSIPRATRKSVFTDVQLQTLEDSFQFKQHLSPKSREWLAKLIGLSKRQVITWFQNRRARERRKAGIKMPRHGKKCVIKDSLQFQTVGCGEFRWEVINEIFADAVAHP